MNEGSVSCCRQKGLVLTAESLEVKLPDRFCHIPPLAQDVKNEPTGFDVMRQPLLSNKYPCRRQSSGTIIRERPKSSSSRFPNTFGRAARLPSDAGRSAGVEPLAAVGAQVHFECENLDAGNASRGRNEKPGTLSGGVHVPIQSPARSDIAVSSGADGVCAGDSGDV